MTTRAPVRSLYEMTDETREILDVLDGIPELGEDATDEQRAEYVDLCEMLERRLGSIEGGIEGKVDAIAKILADRNALAEGAAHEAKRLHEIERRLDRGSDRLREYVRKSLSLISPETVRIQGELCQVVLAKQGNRAPRVANPDAVPNTWKTATLELPYDDVPVQLRERIRKLSPRGRDVVAYVKETGDLVDGVEMALPTRRMTGLPKRGEE